MQWSAVWHMDWIASSQLRWMRLAGYVVLWRIEMEILDLTQDEYFSLRGDPPFVSSTSLKCFREQGSWTYYHQHEVQLVEPKAPSTSMRTGTLFHDLAANMGEPSWIQLPESIDGQPLNLRKKDHRVQMAEAIDRAAEEGTYAVTPDMASKVFGMYRAMQDNPAIRELVNQEAQREVVATGHMQGVPVKGMSDVLLDDNTIIDYKTTSRNTPVEFIQDVFRFRYHWQAAFYWELFGGNRFFIVAVRNFAPYEAMLYEIPQHLIKSAASANRQALEDLSWCRAVDNWHSPGWDTPIDIMEDSQRRKA